MGSNTSVPLLPAQVAFLEGLKKNVNEILKYHNHTLTSFTFSIFGFYKEKFDLKFFAVLLNQLNQKYGYTQADLIFNALGKESKGEMKAQVDLKDLQLLLTATQKPNQSLESKVEQFRTLIKEYDPLLVLQYYDNDGDNCLTPLEIEDMLQSADIFTPAERQTIIKQIYRDKKILSITQILTYLSISQSYDDQSACPLMSLSKPKNVPRQIVIPQILVGSLNQNFRVSQDMINWLASVVGSRTKYVDVQKPAISPEHKYVHISNLFKQYFLFQMRGSIVRRDAQRTGHGRIMEARNIRQGHGKDCYIMSALSGVAQYYPEHIYNLFLIDKTEVDVFVVKLFIDGEWKLIVTDAEFPVTNKGKLVYAQPSKHQIWVLLVEKAWASVFGSYLNIEEGSNQEGLVAVTGAPCLRFESCTPDQLKAIKAHLTKGYIASVSTNKLENMSKDEQKKMGIYSNHAYTLLYIVDGIRHSTTKNKTTLMYLRNPWGKGEWKGEWSFECLSWTTETRQKLGYVRDPKDGSFYVCLEDFRKYFAKIKVCCINPTFVNSSIRLKSSANQYVTHKFTIVHKGDYFLSLHQENKRKFKNSNKEYKYSNSNIYIAKLREDKCMEPVGSKAANNTNLFIQVALQPGQYICLARIKWLFAPEGEFILGSYGPRPLTFSSVTVKSNFISQFIRLKANQEIGDKSYYGKLNSPQSYKIVFMSLQLGYGYILICNNEESRTLRGTLTLGNVKGINMVPPYEFTINLDVKPKSREVYPCVVSSNGFQYKITQQLKFV